MRPLAGDEVPDGPVRPHAARRPWLLRPRPLALIFGGGTLLGLAGDADGFLPAWFTLLALAGLRLLLAVYLWHLAEHELLGRPAPPRLRWLLDAPSRHPGLRLYAGVVIVAWAAAWRLAPLLGAVASSCALALLLLLAAPWLGLSLVQSGGARPPVPGQALAFLRGAGPLGPVALALLVVPLTALQPALLADAAPPVCWALVAAALLSARAAGRLLATRAAFLGVETEEDRRQAADAAAFRVRLDRLLQRLHQCRETGDVPRGVALVEAFLAEDGYVHDQRLLHELGAWRWPRLAREHARNVVGRLLAAERDRAAWALAMTHDPLDGDFLPASVDDLARLAETAAGPAERRAALAMVRRADRARDPGRTDARLARLWLAAAELALEEGESSLARVWLARAETRYPRELAAGERRARRAALRRALGAA